MVVYNRSTSSNENRVQQPVFRSCSSLLHEPLIADLNSDSSGVIDAVEQDRNIEVPHIFIHRIACPLEMPIIIDDKNAVSNDSRIQMNELVFGGAIPIRIQTQKRNVSWRRIRD